jgi:ABC-type oligopeptide transport system ATPase subunit
MPEPLLEVRNLKKYFPVIAGILRHQVGDIKAVDGISFTVYPQEVLGIVGESGSGKSTAARAVIRLIEPTAGEIYFEGKNFLALDQTALKLMRKNIQIVFQDPYASLNPRKTIGENIGEALLYHGFVKDRYEQETRVRTIMAQTGLREELIHRYPHEISGGQQQRVCIGRAIAMEPKLIVLDEALSALDVSVQAQILNLLLDLKQRLGLSYLFISHDLSVVRHIADRVSVMHHGVIVEAGLTEEVYNNPQAPYTRKLLASIPPSQPRRKS